MGKYLLQVNYTAEGLRGLAKEGAENRVEYIRRFAESVGGTVEVFYFALGDRDAFVVMDAPGDTDITAASLAVGAAGVASISTVKLLTPAEVDAAIAKIADYRAPGT
jgi:uncharacterized protein with GYD domain